MPFIAATRETLTSEGKNIAPLVCFSATVGKKAEYKRKTEHQKQLEMMCKEIILFVILFLFSHAHKHTVMDVKWNKNGNWLLSASRDHLIKLYDVRNMKDEVIAFRGHKKEATSMYKCFITSTIYGRRYCLIAVCLFVCLLALQLHW